MQAWKAKLEDAFFYVHNCKKTVGFSLSTLWPASGFVLLDSQKSTTTVLTLLCTGRDHFHKRQAVFDFENFSPTKCDDNYFFHHHCIGRRIGQGILEKPPWISKMGLKPSWNRIWTFINLRVMPGGQKIEGVVENLQLMKVRFRIKLPTTLSHVHVLFYASNSTVKWISYNSFLLEVLFIL